MLYFQEWNDRIAAHFFRPEMAGRRVFLFVTRDLIDELGKPAGAGVDEFVSAVKRGPISRQASWDEGMCVKAYRTMLTWKQRRQRNFPPYIAYLALFVLAAGWEGDFRSYAYYPRLRTVLGESPAPRRYPSFDRMIELWDDLERWSTVDKNGDLGIFYTSIAGSWIHVGIPRAQMLLSERERHVLPAVFTRAGIDPALPPPDRYFVNLLLRAGHDEFRSGTLALLEGTGDSERELRDALIEVLLDELRDWEGMPPGPAAAADVLTSMDKPATKRGSLRLCCRLDEIAGSVQLTLRCKTEHEFSDDGLVLVGLREDELLCDEHALGWSTPFRVRSGLPLDAAKLNWTRGLRLNDPDGDWLFLLSPSPVRILINGTQEGVPGLVEMPRLPAESPFYLAVHQDHEQLITRWGRESCQGFRPLPVAGLPAGWRLFTATSATDDELVRDVLPVLELPSSVRLRTEGGIRAGRGNRFFSFAPPWIVLEAPPGLVELFCNGIPLNQDPPSTRYSLPPGLPAGAPVTIEARQNGKGVTRLTVFLDDTFPWPAQNQYASFDRFRSQLDANGSPVSSVAGARVAGMDPIESSFGTVSAQAPDGVEDIWYTDELPEGWAPIWATTLGNGRDRKIRYCGCRPLRPASNSPRAELGMAPEPDSTRVLSKPVPGLEVEADFS